jgi:CHAT domain-containing protein/tetratricopeptide (TPR) repeat protein
LSPLGRTRLAALALQSLLFIGSSCGQDPSALSVTPGHAALIEATGARRFVEPRLAGFHYGPFAKGSARRRLSDREKKALREAADMIRKENRSPSPGSLHAVGVLALLQAQPDSAVASLESAAAADAGNTAVLSDLAAAYLVRAATLTRPVDLVAALDTAEKAIALDPGRPETLYNHALAQERIALHDQAERSWKLFLKIETEPGWRGEAESALKRLQGPIERDDWREARERLRGAALAGDQQAVTALVARCRQEARSLAEEELLAAWAALRSAGNDDAAAVELAAARAIGRSLVELSGDRLLADSVGDIDRALHDQPARLPGLVAGVLAYRDGLVLVRERSFARAEAPLEQARQTLLGLGNPLEAWASFLLVRCAYQKSDHREVERRVLDLLGRLDPGRYPVVTARARWVLGTSQMSLARPAEALESYRSALAQFERVQEHQHLAAVHSLVASAFDELGDSHAAWEHRTRALHGLAEHRDEPRLRTTLISVAHAALAAGYPRAACALQTAAVDLARKSGDPELLADALRNRATILERAGLAGAGSDLAEAGRHCQRIEEDSIRRSIHTDLLAAQGRCLVKTAPVRALAALNAAIATYRAGDRRVMLPGALADRARALRATGRDQEAERDLLSAIEVLEEERGSVGAGEHRGTFAERMEPVFDAMVLLQTELGRDERALDFSERRRARLLLDWLSALPEDTDRTLFQLSGWTRTRLLPELRREIPPDVTLLAYEALPDRILLWVVRRDGVRQRQVRVTAQLLETRIRSLEDALDGPETGLQQAAGALHGLLIAPVADLLPEGQTVVFVPEGRLAAVPFGLLFDGRTRRYLIEDRPFAVSPSVNVFVRLQEQAGNGDFSGAEVLVMADPAFDRSLFPGLGRLPEARREGRLIQALYGPQARSFVGEAATRAPLLEGLQRYRILHLGGHAQANPSRPLLSSLPLAPRPAAGDSGVLYVREIIGPPDAATDLVVLSACRSAGGAAQPGEGVAGLVWPFFSRGVPLVVASLWDVEDAETASLFTSFYRRLRRGAPPISALREAQIAALATSRKANHRSFGWAAFQLYGAAPAFPTKEE